mgnify:FL=1|tara:strand:- start:878 stop:1318 length:441 start_codon:yes stop_codon:yes gene_type:complete
MIIQLSSSQTTYEVRHPVLRKGKPVESCRFENDDHPESIHLCAKKKDIIIGVLSALPNNCPDFPLKKSYQLRGIAINHRFQRMGIGSLLVQKVEQQIRLNKSIEYIWLNARVKTKNFYLNLEYLPVGKIFNIIDIGMHQRYIKNNS